MKALSAFQYAEFLTFTQMVIAKPQDQTLFTFMFEISPWAWECRLQLQTLNHFNCLVLDESLIMNSQTVMLRQTYI